jgi:negative regulator of sigma-B (phosphoserine phosphatase)
MGMVMGPVTSSTPLVTYAIAARPLLGQDVSGDLEVVASFAGGVLLAVIDGLGHGREAAAAARLAADVLEAHAGAAPVDLVSLCHDALRGTRGAALLIVSLSAGARSATWVGIGNVEGWRCRWDAAGKLQREALISFPGVVGYQLPRLRGRSADIARGDKLVLATDGVRPEFIGEIAEQGEPAHIATTILERYGRSNDDALVLAAQYRGDAP